MSEREDNTISIVRMEKLLTGITSKIDKHDVQNLPLLREIIDLTELFKTLVISRMKKTPEVERMHIINLHDCQKKVAEALSELEVLQNISEEQNTKSEIFLKDIVTCVNDEEEIMKNIRETSEVEIPKEMKESMQKMLIVKEQQEARKKQLQSEIESAERQLHSIVEFNAITEKKLFDECAKIEQEYKDLIAKYDCDIGAAHALMEKLSKDKEVLKTETESMEAQLAVQRTLYIQYKNEREIALMKVFTEKLKLFTQNRAVRIIQRAWRAYFERISLKKRRKGRRK
ncbi:dynein regulatory complex protein 10-like [Linepithema humile]|uniref:dynein regulatory complex protein 10-like n=1 Tax=Linepithema humile TaxID=83485 RepID=UPI00351DE2D9